MKILGKYVAAFAFIAALLLILSIIAIVQMKLHPQYFYEHSSDSTGTSKDDTFWTWLRKMSWLGRMAGNPPNSDDPSKSVISYGVWGWWMLLTLISVVYLFFIIIGLWTKGEGHFHIFSAIYSAVLFFIFIGPSKIYLWSLVILLPLCAIDSQIANSREKKILKKANEALEAELAEQPRIDG